MSEPPVRLNWFERALAAVAPRTALARAEAQARLNMLARGGFEAGRQDWRGNSWRPEPAGPNISLYGDLVTMRNRARSLVRNNPLAKRSIGVMTAHSVGCGIRPSWQTESKPQRARLRDAWTRFVEGADARRQVDFYGLQEQAAQAIFESGEVLALRGKSREGSPTYLLTESDQLDHNREGVWEGRMTRMGVAFAQGHHYPEGYWLFDYFPGDQVLWGASAYSQYHPADGVIHAYRVRRPGQVRGIPELGASIPILRDLADYRESALVKARIEACFSAFVTSEDASANTLAQRVDTATNANGTTGSVNYGTLSPGLISRLHPGESVAFAQPSTQSDFGAFALHAGMEAASGVGVTYDQATGDLRQANYSSLKAGKIEFRRMIEMFQNLNFIPMVCKPAYRDFINAGLISGALKPSDEKVPVRWITPAWEPIDPVKDLEADMAAVRSGRLTLGDFIASWGEDPHEQLEQIAAFNKDIDRLGLVLDIDPRKVAAAGVKQMPDAGEADGAPSKAKD